MTTIISILVCIFIGANLVIPSIALGKAYKAENVRTITKVTLGTVFLFAFAVFLIVTLNIKKYYTFLQSPVHKIATYILSFNSL